MNCLVFSSTAQVTKGCLKEKKNPKRCLLGISSGREEEIRTLDTVARILPFQGSVFNHSATSLYMISRLHLRLQPPDSYRDGHLSVCVEPKPLLQFPVEAGSAKVAFFLNGTSKTLAIKKSFLRS